MLSFSFDVGFTFLLGKNMIHIMLEPFLSLFPIIFKKYI